MSILYNTGDWFTLRPGTNYRKYELYAMEWPLVQDLSHMIVCAAPYGGPMAIMRDPKQITKLTGSAKPIIQIFNAAGKYISTIHWDSGKLLTMGWSNGEELLCVQTDGLVLRYDIFGQFQHKLYVDKEAKDTKVIDARIFQTAFGTGVAVMTSNHRVFLINNVKEPKSRRLSDIPRTSAPPTCWDIVTEERDTYALVACGRELYRCGQADSICTLCPVPGLTSSAVAAVADDDPQPSAIVAMAVSYNNHHQYLALYTQSGTIWLGTTDMKTKLCTFHTNRAVRPHQIAWIMDADSGRSSDAVAIAYAATDDGGCDATLMVVNVAGDSNTYTYDTCVHLIPEMDGVRVLSGGSHEMIQRVPLCVLNIFAINSQAASSWLFEAHKKYAERSHQANEYLAQSRSKLSCAVAECVEAAAFEWDTRTQKSLLRAAYFGKSFVPGYDPDEYMRTGRVLRVLNALRAPSVGVPLTMKQFQHLGANVLLNRLVYRQQYALSMEIAGHLRLPESRILEEWAANLLRQTKLDDETVAARIERRFRLASARGAPFCAIAGRAEQLGRKQLAVRLLKLEPRRRLQVPLLLRLGEQERALQAATQSGDTDLVYQVVDAVCKTTDLAAFLMLVRQYPMALNVYKRWCAHANRPVLEKIHDQEDDRLAQAEWALRDAAAAATAGGGGGSVRVDDGLPAAVLAYRLARQSGVRQCTVEADLCDEARRLLKAQSAMAERLSAAGLVGQPLQQTVRRLLLAGDVRQAEKLRVEYRMPDRRFWWLRVQTLAEQYQWAELEKFGRPKRSPIGFEPFVEVCLAQGKVEEAQKYLGRCRDEVKVKWYIRAGLLKEAADVAFEFRDPNGLESVLHVAKQQRNAAVAEHASNLMAQLSAKK